MSTHGYYIWEQLHNLTYTSFNKVPVEGQCEWLEYFHIKLKPCLYIPLPPSEEFSLESY